MMFFRSSKSSDSKSQNLESSLLKSDFSRECSELVDTPPSLLEKCVSDTPAVLIDNKSNVASNFSLFNAANVSYSPTATPNVHVADEMSVKSDASNFESEFLHPTSFIDLLSKITCRPGRVRTLNCGGVEAIPSVSGEIVKVQAISTYTNIPEKNILMRIAHSSRRPSDP